MGDGNGRPHRGDDCWGRGSRAGAAALSWFGAAGGPVICRPAAVVVVVVGEPGGGEAEDDKGTAAAAAAADEGAPAAAGNETAGRSPLSLPPTFMACVGCIIGVMVVSFLIEDPWAARHSHSHQKSQRAVLSFYDSDAQRLPTTRSGRAWDLWQGARVCGLLGSIDRSRCG